MSSSGRLRRVFAALIVAVPLTGFAAADATAATGDYVLSEVNASEFYLWSSATAGVNWSVSPAGLSSNGYDGHIFWDAETWMYPSLLASIRTSPRG